MHLARHRLRRPAAVLATLILTTLMAIGLGGPVAADQPVPDTVDAQAQVDPGGDDPIVIGDQPTDTTTDVTFSVPWAVFIVGSVIPLITALLARTSWTSSRKGTVTFLLSLVTSALTVFIDNGGSVPLLQLLTAVFATATVAQVSYRQVWAGTALQQKLLAVGSPAVSGA